MEFQIQFAHDGDNPDWRSSMSTSGASRRGSSSGRFRVLSPFRSQLNPGQSATLLRQALSGQRSGGDKRAVALTVRRSSPRWNLALWALAPLINP
jgi:hypothetical protein